MVLNTCLVDMFFYFLFFSSKGGENLSLAPQTLFDFSCQMRLFLERVIKATGSNTNFTKTVHDILNNVHNNIEFISCLLQNHCHVESLNDHEIDKGECLDVERPTNGNWGKYMITHLTHYMTELKQDIHSLSHSENCTSI